MMVECFQRMLRRIRFHRAIRRQDGIINIYWFKFGRVLDAPELMLLCRSNGRLIKFAFACPGSLQEQLKSIEQNMPGVIEHLNKNT